MKWSSLMKTALLTSSKLEEILVIQWTQDGSSTSYHIDMYPILSSLLRSRVLNFAWKTHRSRFVWVRHTCPNEAK